MASTHCQEQQLSETVTLAAAEVDANILLAGRVPSSGDSDDDSSDSGTSAGEAGRGDGSGNSDSDAEMDTLLLRDELKMQGDGGDQSTSSSSDDENVNVPRRRYIPCALQASAVFVPYGRVGLMQDYDGSEVPSQLIP